MPQPVNRQRPQARHSRSAPARADDWNGVAERFLADGRRRNHTPATLSAYRMALLGPRTRTFLEDHGVRGVSDFTADSLRALEEELRAAGLSVPTVHLYHRVLKTFLGFCDREGHDVDYGRVSAVEGPKLPQEEPDTYTPDEATRLLHTARSRRDRMLVEFMLKTGLRLSEVVGMELDDLVDLGHTGAYLRVRQGKGRKDRHVPLDDELLRHLRLYIDHHRPAGCHALFTTTRAPIRPMTPEAVKSVLDRLGQETGIHCHAHKFRHTFASRAIADGIDPITLQRVLGHTTLTMVSRYVHYSPVDLIESWKKRR